MGGATVFAAFRLAWVDTLNLFGLCERKSGWGIKALNSRNGVIVSVSVDLGDEGEPVRYWMNIAIQTCISEYV